MVLLRQPLASAPARVTAEAARSAALRALAEGNLHEKAPLWALAVVNGNSEQYENGYHPRR
jgi:hypothetical protein